MLGGGRGGRSFVPEALRPRLLCGDVSRSKRFRDSFKGGVRSAGGITLRGFLRFFKAGE